VLGAASAESLLRSTFPDEDLRVFTPQRTRFRCGCSEERVANTLRMLGRAEIESILAERGTVEVTCEFCQRSYRYGAGAARALFESPGTRTPPEATRH